MIKVDRAGEHLVVWHGPSAPYKIVTWVWMPVVGAALVWRDLTLGASFMDGVDRAQLAGTLVLPLLVGLALLRGWSQTAYRFDRSSGTLVIQSTGPVRAARTRQVLLAVVSAVIDRRRARRRSIELSLADGSALVIARAGAADSAALDRVARELGDLLSKPVQLAEGAMLGARFEIERLVARGGMGLVYRARDRTTGLPVALKVVLATGADTARNERFQREIEVLASLDHPRIAKYVGHGTTPDGQAFLAMQWLDGEDLGEALERGPLSRTDALRVLAEAAHALAPVHARGIIHRDLKPSNLFLRDRSPAGLVLLDFGIARPLQRQTRITVNTAIVGTPHYMAPEQASSARDMRPAADVFALGCIFYECLTGRRPFDAPQLFGVLARILFDNPEPVGSLRPEVPEAWLELLGRMLAKDPARRPADAAALLAEVGALQASAEADARDAANAPANARAPRDDPSRAEPLDALRDTLVEPERAYADQVLVCVVLLTPGPTAAPDWDPEHLDSVRSALHRFGCPIERLADGSLLATVLPRYSATDQVRVAASCALHLRELMPGARIALATGRAALRGGQRIGDAVDRAAQLLERELSHTGIRIDELSAQLLGERFITLVREDTSLLVGERQDLDESRLLLGKPTPCVGRELELIQLEGLMAGAVEEAVPKAALVLGPPGIGKSRLRHELLRRVQTRYPHSTLLVGFGDPLNAGSPYVLVGDALRRHAGMRVADDPAHARALVHGTLCKHVPADQRQRVSEFLGEMCGAPFPGEHSPPLCAARADHRVMSEQIGLAFRDWLSAECAAHPLMLVLEDVQWGDALSFKLLEAAGRELEQAALCVVALGRPEAEEVLPKLLSGRWTLSLGLRALSPKASEQLIRGVLGDALPEQRVARMVRLAAGNALFLEEVIRAAVEGKAGDVPETVLAVLQARLSRLAPEQRLVLRAASVLGETCWLGGVRHVCEAWGGVSDLERRLAHLVTDELVSRARVSRFPADTEYAFRHALVCDAAHGLLTESDRKAGHLAAARWLESMGETDGIVLARHAAEGGDRERAILFGARAAEQSLDRYDFEQALGRAAKTIADGAQGSTLGVLRGVESSAYYSMGMWPQCAEAGLAALELLPRGGAFWCATVEKLMQVLPNIGALERNRQLAEEMFRIVPAADARTAYLRALTAQLVGHSLAGAHEQGQACVDFIDRLLADGSGYELSARASAKLWRAVFIHILGTDVTLALALAQQAERDFSDSQVMYRLSLALTVQAFIWWGLGDLEASEHAARRGRAVAQQIRDDYHTALADWYLGLALSGQATPEKLDEAERCARTMLELHPTPLFEATSQNLSAHVAVARGDWVRAEHEGRKARAGMAPMVPYALLASAQLVQSLTRQGRSAEAAAIAKEDLSVLGALRGPVCSEVLFRVAAAEALFEAGERGAAESVLREALHQIELRAAKIEDHEMRARFLSGRRENQRALELSRTWL